MRSSNPETTTPQSDNQYEIFLMDATIEEFPDPEVEKQRLQDKQIELADLLGTQPNRLKGLVFCDVCDGHGQLTEVTLGKNALYAAGFATDNKTSSKMCGECDGTGFRFGSLDLSTQEWIAISKQNSNKTPPPKPGTKLETKSDDMEGPLPVQDEQVALDGLLRTLPSKHKTSYKPKSHSRRHKRKNH